MPTNRTCDLCGGAIPGRMPRSRDKEDRLVCDGCKDSNAPGWMTTNANLSVIDASELRRREAEAVASISRIRRAKHQGLSTIAHDSGDNAVVNHCPFCGSGAVVGGSDGTITCDFCHSPFTVQVQPAHPFMPQTVDGQPVTPPGMPGGEETELSAPSDPSVEETGEDVAADALGDADPTGTNGPVAPGQPPSKQPPAAPKPPGGDKPKGKGGQPPWLKNKASAKTDHHPRCMVNHTDDDDDERICTCDAYPPFKQSMCLNIGGVDLTSEAYMARLALQHADDRDAVLDTVRTMHTQASKTGCPACGGSGEVHFAYDARDPASGDTKQCAQCHGSGEVDLNAPDNWDLREGSMRPFSTASAEDDASKPTSKGLYRHDILAEDILMGDFLDINGMTRVSSPPHFRHDGVLVQIKMRGARSPSIKGWERGESVKVWRKA